MIAPAIATRGIPPWILTAEERRGTSQVVPYIVVGMVWPILSIIGTHPWLGMPRPASLMKDKIGVVQVLFFTSMPLLLLSGGSSPLQAMPWEVR